MIYCFGCSTENPLADEFDICLECGCVVEECEWDSIDEVWVPAPPYEE